MKPQNEKKKKIYVIKMQLYHLFIKSTMQALKKGKRKSK